MIERTRKVKVHPSLIHRKEQSIVEQHYRRENLRDAIKHCKQVARECKGTKCSEEHTQLADWLEDLIKHHEFIDEYNSHTTNVHRLNAIAKDLQDNRK